jgi:outer membrane autotransporter protein
VKSLSARRFHLNGFALPVDRYIAGRRLKRRSLQWLLGTVVLVVPTTALAQNTNWTGLAGTADWTNPSNWDSGVPNGTSRAFIDGATVQIATPGQTVNDLELGTGANAALTIQSGGTLSNTAGSATVGAGALTITGTGSRYDAIADLLIGRGIGSSTVTVAAGGQLSTNRSFIGEGPGGVTTATTITATVTGAGSVWDAGSYFGVGGGTATSTLTVSAGGVLKAQDPVAISSIGFGAQGSALVTDAGSQILLGGNTQLAIGEAIGGIGGNGTLTIQNGGMVTAYTVTMGAFDPSASGTLNVNGTPGARGVLQTTSLTKDIGTASVSFDGGILRAMADSATFISGFNPGDIVIQSGGMFVDSNGFNVVASSALNGTGGLTKQGAGILTLTGVDTYIGPTTVSGGTLVVNGSIADSTVSVQTAATLAGAGTVGATTVLAGGTIAPGNNSIGTLHVSGAYAQNAGSIYQVLVDPNSNASGLIAVTGTATLANGAVLNVTQTTPGNYQPGARYTVLSATGGVTGTYNLTGETASVSTFLGLVGTYDADDVYLTVMQTRGFGEPAQTPNQIATSGGLASLPAGNPLATAVLNLPTDAAARSAFDQLSGEIHASAKTAAIEDSHFVRDAAVDRIREAFCAVGAPATDRKFVATQTGFAQDPPDQKPRKSGCATAADRFTMWGQVFGSWGHTNGDGNAAALDHTTGGFFAGVDAPIFDGWRAGILAGYGQSDFNVSSRASSGSSDDYYVGLYGGTQWGALGLRTGVTYTSHDIRTGRSVVFPGFADNLTAGYNAGTTQIFGDLGYKVDAGGIAFEPFADLAYVDLRTDGFSEQGGAAALTGRGGDTDTAFTTLGLRASTGLVSFGEMSATARGSLGWRHAFGDIVPVSVVSLAGGNAFSIAGVPIAVDAAVIDAGLDLHVTSQTTLGLSYGGQFGNGAIDQSVRGNFTVRF